VDFSGNPPVAQAASQQSPAQAVPAAPEGVPAVPVGLPGEQAPPRAIAAGEPPRGIADVLEAADLSDPVQRARAVAAIEEIQSAGKRAGIARATELGMALRVERPDGTVMEIAGVDEAGQPVYFITHNSSAAISTGANLLRLSPYNLSGAGLTIGMWDGGSGRASHQEFASGRMVVKDASGSIDHATHVGGTLAATGATVSARGMAPIANVDSYDWNSDMAEMTSRGAAAPNQPGTIFLSNHSYGYIGGWYRTGGSNPAYIWYGSGTTASSIDPRFGQYNTYARDSDALAFSAPYYLIFRSAGNERTDNPSNGQSIQLSPSSTATTSYDSAIHPGGDGTYRGGFDSISFDSIAKNVITVGSVLDAVTSGVRDPSKAALSSFTSWGPTDDGRIKPDIVANGDGVYSALNGSNSAYGTYSGTSMSAPNATGSATLLIEEYARLFPGGAMRSSTLKGLLIHTADDRGNLGPDYKFGWGLINVQAAAELIRDHAANPVKIRMTENLITSADTTIGHDFVWDGTSPIRVTLSWTDPAGSATTSSELRTARLRNNLDVKITGPTGTTHLPYVMPFVGSWTQDSMNAPATTGVNNTDNVEQVYISSPAGPGVYRVVVSFQGTLANNQQHYALLVTGSAAEEPPPPPLALSSLSPPTALAGATTTLDLSGTSLATVTQVKLTRSGSTDILATNLTMIGSSLRCSVNLTGATPGTWNVVASSASESATLANIFSVASALFFENFDNSPSGWTSSLANSWTLTTAKAYSPASAYFIAAPASKILAYLTSPAIPVATLPAAGMQLKFWHSYDTQAGQDGGRLEFSTDNGSTWFGVEAAGSGASFASNGYNTLITQPNGNNPNGSAFGGQNAWSGNSNGFIQTIVNLTSAKFSNKTIRLRWAFATNNSTASNGWHFDSVSLTTDGDSSNAAPVITAEATAPGSSSVVETLDGVDYTYFLVPATATNLTVTASDDGGAANLKFSWAASGPAAVDFSPNASNPAATTTASFEAVGDYLITVTATDAGGLAATSTIRLRVVPTNTSLQVTPSSVTLAVGASQLLQATMLDQFANPMASQPTSFSWSTTGGGSVSSAGLYSATTKGSGFAVTASATVGTNPFSNFAQVSVTALPATITLGSLSQTYDGAQKSATATTSPGTYPVSLTYDGSPSGPTTAGSYAVVATVDTSTHEGSAEGVLTIAKAPASVTLSGLSQDYDGSAKVVGVTVVPGKPFSLTYAGSPSAPSAVGSYAVSATVTDANYQGSASGLLTITSNFLAWEQDVFSPAQILAGEGAPEADADKDGLLNLAEYALGTDPNSFTEPPLVGFSPDSLTLTFTRPKGLTDVTYSAESCSTLGSWSPVTLELLSSTETTETLRAQVSRAQFPSVRFLRLRFLR
jgi:hypothetical protein